MSSQESAQTQREQIAKANKTMFIWVAGASAIFGICIVVSIFLAQKVIFKEKVLAEMSRTQSTLEENNENSTELKQNIKALNANEALMDSMTADETNPVQVVLDSLPDVANSSAFGASLQEKILKDDSISIEKLIVDPVFGSESQDSMTAQLDESSAATEDNVITFSLAISASSSDEKALQDALKRIEKSIRPITITKLSIERNGDRILMTAFGVSYYEPARTVDLKEKTVKP